MKSTIRAAVLLVCAMVVLFSVSSAQDDLAAKLAKMGLDAAKGYTGPILSGWAADINSGFYHSADLHDILGFDAGIKLAISRPATDDKTYTFDLPNQIQTSFGTLNAGTDYDKQVTANSAVGGKGQTDVNLKSSSSYYNAWVLAGSHPILSLPGGFDLPAIPLPMPQINVGLPLGLEVMARFVPTISAGDAGKFSMSGFGLRYDIDQFLPLFPVDIAAHFFTQKMTFKDKGGKDIFSGSGTAYGVEVSKKLLLLTVYGGFQLEKGKMEIAGFTGTNPANPSATVQVPGFTVEGKNKSRITVGARVLLLIVNAHVEYSISKNPVILAGVGISLR